MRVLLAEDERPLAEAIRRRLEHYMVDVSPSMVWMVWMKPITTVSQTEAMWNGLKCGLENGLVNGELRTAGQKGGTQE